MRMPVGTLVGNWAYMVMASLAWTLKAWFALALPEEGRWAEQYAAEKRAVLKMEFRTFQQAFVAMPCQIVRAGRRIRGHPHRAPPPPRSSRRAPSIRRLLSRERHGLWRRSSQLRCWPRCMRAGSARRSPTTATRPITSARSGE